MISPASFFPGRASEKVIRDTVEFCSALNHEFNDRLPQEHRNNTMVASAWWSIALYVQVTELIGRRRFHAPTWELASELAAKRIAAELIGNGETEIEAAMAGVILTFCKLWIAAFGIFPDTRQISEPEFVRDELSKLFESPEIGLSERLNLSVSEDGQNFETSGDLPNQEKPSDEIELLTSSFAAYFAICARSSAR